MPPRLTDYRVLSFDCYGTLIDWETGIWDALQPLLMANGCTTLTRAPALEAFARQESAEQTRSPTLRYPELLARVHAGLARELGLRSDPELDRAFGESLPHWPAFADSADALRRLQRRYRLVILSNVHEAGFAASQRKLGVEFDAVYTAEAIGSYKPSPANFAYLLEHLEADLGLSHGALLHVAQSLHHDHVPAKAAGLANAWIDRQRLSERGAWGATAPVAERPPIDHRFFSLAELADAVEAEQG